MKSLLRRLAVVPILSTAVLGFASGTADAAPGAYTCVGGPVPAGTYSSLAITGGCSIDEGAVTVTGSVSVGPTSAATLEVGGGPTGRLTVKGSLTADGAGSVFLHCTGFANCGGTQTVTVAGNLTISRTAFVVLDGVDVRGSLSVSGTTGNCDGPFSTVAVASTTVRGNLNVTGNTTCSVLVSTNNVNGSMTVTGNTVNDPYGQYNVVDRNTIKGNLACAGNSAVATQIVSTPNVVKGRTTGDCTFLATTS